MENNWQTLKDKLNEQISEIIRVNGTIGPWGSCGQGYLEVLNMMHHIEEGIQDDLIPYKSTWYTEGDIEADLLEELQEQRETFNSDEEYIKWLNEYVKSNTQGSAYKIVVRVIDNYIKSIAK